MKFAPSDIKASGKQFDLVGSSATSAYASRSYKVIPFWRSKYDRFWLTLRLRFELQKTKHRLTEISLPVFKGDASDDQKNPLFRAEWGCITHFDEEPHAQPHWHVYPEESVEFLLSRGNLSEAIEVEEFGANGAKDKESVLPDKNALASMHYAMAAQWQNGSSHRFQLTEEKMVKWLKGCVDYALTQIKYTYS